VSDYSATSSESDGAGTALAEVADLAPVVGGLATAPNIPSLRELKWMSEALKTSIVLPKGLREGGAPAILSVMLAGRELGVPPMLAMRMIDMINGVPAVRSELKLALAKARGHDIRPVIREQGRVRVKCVIHDSHEVEWAYARDFASPDATIASEIEVEGWGEVKGEKVWKPLVEKANWRSWCGPMLWARAVAQLCREHCPEAVGGMYSTEELS
jgi:hypothetical protein